MLLQVTRLRDRVSGIYFILTKVKGKIKYEKTVCIHEWFDWAVAQTVKQRPVE